jgi:hypothetical protein
MNTISDRNLPVQPISVSTGLALITQCHDLDRFVGKVQKLTNVSILSDGGMIHGSVWLDKDDLPNAKVLLAQRDQMRTMRTRLSREATPDEIGVALLKTTACFPNLKGNKYFAEALYDETAITHPSVYVLTRAVSTVRCQREFLSIAEMVTAIDAAKRQEKRLGETLADNRLESGIVDAEERMGLITREEADATRKRLGLSRSYRRNEKYADLFDLDKEVEKARRNRRRAWANAEHGDYFVAEGTVPVNVKECEKRLDLAEDAFDEAFDRHVSRDGEWIVEEALADEREHRRDR